MKLLIVDDQLTTAQGIAYKIDWESEGFHEVDIAKNAMEARLSFRKRAPDVMLCDIEMPVESGLELCAWVMQQAYSTQIIILTCHAEFEYAQESIKLNVADYLVQPTSYENIQRTVHRVVDKLRQKNEAEKKLAEYEQNLPALRSSLWGRYLKGDTTISSHEAFMPFFQREDACCLIMFQIVRWTAISGQWQGSLMCTAMQNYLSEIFELESGRAVVVYMEPDLYAAILYLSADAEKDSVWKKLEYFCDIYKMYMPCSIAVYPSQIVQLREMPKVWQSLQKRLEQNVARRAGVFMEPEQKNPVSTDIAAHWNTLLQGYDSQKMAEETIAYIDALTAQRRMDDEVLRQMYWSLFRFLSGSDWFGNSMDSMLQDEEASALCQDAMHSVDALRRLILYIRDTSPEGDAQGHEQQAIRYVKQYVRAHIEADIRVEEIAADLHIGADYLTKIFKKTMNCTIKNYIIQQKMMEARNLLRTTSLPVSVVAAKLGYYNFSHFSSSYKKVLGYSPSEERKE